MLTIFSLLITIFLAALLLIAYVVTPIVGWLVMNPSGGLVLLIIIVILVSVLVWEEMKEG